MANRRLLLLLVVVVSGLGFLSLITVIIVQAQSDDNPPPPDQPAVVPDESSAIDWSQVVLPPHDEREMAAPPVNVPIPDKGGEVTVVPPAPPIQNSYTVQAGDNLFRIARRFGVSVADLSAANQIADPSRIYPGQILTIATENTAAPPPAPPPATANPLPGETGTYLVQSGDTLSAIARKFGVDMMALAAASNLANPSLIRIGQILTIPDSTAVPAPSNPEPAPVEATPGETTPGDGTIYFVQRGDSLYTIARKFGIPVQTLTAVNQINNPSLIYPGQKLLVTAAANDSNLPPAEPAPESIFIWPTTYRRIVKQYTSGHRAIDIVVPTGEAVEAMAAGKVEYAGWNAHGYGNLVVLDHGNGWRTLYAHNSSIQVKTGDAVAQGDVIALSGSTGNSTMSHIHLEMMFDFGAVNPCLYLPGGC